MHHLRNLLANDKLHLLLQVLRALDLRDDSDLRNRLTELSARNQELRRNQTAMHPDDRNALKGKLIRDLNNFLDDLDDFVAENQLEDQLQEIYEELKSTEDLGGMPPQLKYRCNREAYLTAFGKAFDECAERPVQSFALRGFAEHLPDFLVKRVLQDYYQEEGEVIETSVRVAGYGSLRKQKTEVLRLLFEQFGGGKADQKLTPEHFLRLPRIRHADYVLIDLAAESRFWENAFPFAEKFTADFAKPLAKDRDLPRVVFFWSVVYADDIRKESALKKLFRRSRRDQILKDLQKLKPDAILDELREVSRDDIRTWVELIEDELGYDDRRIWRAVERQTQFGLKTREAFTMQEVLDIFDFIRKEHKNL